MKTIVCFGDSNTHGYRSEDMGRFPRNERWPGILQELLGPEYDVKEEGLSGRTFAFDDPLFEGLNGRRAIEPVLYTHEPVDLLIVMLGTNDTKERFSLTATNIARSLAFFLEKATSGRAKAAFTNASPDILVIAPPPIGEGYKHTDCAEDMGKDCDVKSARVAGFLEGVCKQLEEEGTVLAASGNVPETGSRLPRLSFLDAATVPGVEMNTIDYMHLTKDAHRALAEAVAQRCTQLLHTP